MIVLSSPPITNAGEALLPYGKTVHLPANDQPRNRRKDAILICGRRVSTKLMCAGDGRSSSLPTPADKKSFLEQVLSDDDGEELIGIRGQRENPDGLVESLESLEREALMGEDEGREPTDYSRRARIFDKSSKVFQALKEDEVDK